MSKNLKQPSNGAGRAERKPLTKAAQEAERTLASGHCDMAKMADASADEIRAALSALGVTVLKVLHCYS